VKDPPSRLLHQPWILFTLEPTSLIQGNMNWWGRIFNWTMSYRTYSTIFNPYGFYLNKTRLKSFKELAVSYKNRTNNNASAFLNCVLSDVTSQEVLQDNSFSLISFSQCIFLKNVVQTKIFFFVLLVHTISSNILKYCFSVLVLWNVLLK
jgi:hypothetical protein